MTQRALARILESTQARVTLAINGGQPFSVRRHDRLDVTYLPERRSLGDAYNVVANATSSEFIGFVHNDCLVPEYDWLNPLVKAAAEHGFAFPLVDTDWEDAERRGVDGLGWLQDTFPPSCCYVVSRKAWKALEGFAPEYEGCHFEDTDLFMRAIKAGYKLALVPEVTVEHQRGVTRGETADESNAAFVRNRMIYVAKWTQPNGQVPFPSLWKEYENGRQSPQESSVFLS